MTTRTQSFTASGTFDVPAGVSCVWVTMIGGGAGGETSSQLAGVGINGAAGGSAEWCSRLPVAVTPEGTLSITIGAKGTKGTVASPGTSTSGTATTVGDYAADGGYCPISGGSSWSSGKGGGVSGHARAPTNSSGGSGTIGSTRHWGGQSGGGSFGAGNPTGNAGGSSVNDHAGGAAGGTANGGAGGGSSPWADGGRGGNHGSGPNGDPATGYGAGGGGGGQISVPFANGDGADGADGFVLIEWIEA